MFAVRLRVDFLLLVHAPMKQSLDLDSGGWAAEATASKRPLKALGLPEFQIEPSSFRDPPS